VFHGPWAMPAVSTCREKRGRMGKSWAYEGLGSSRRQSRRHAILCHGRLVIVAWCTLGQGFVAHVSGNPEGEGADWNPSRTCIRTAISKPCTLVPMHRSLPHYARLAHRYLDAHAHARLALAVKVEFAMSVLQKAMSHQDRLAIANAIPSSQTSGRPAAATRSRPRRSVSIQGPAMTCSKERLFHGRYQVSSQAAEGHHAPRRSATPPSE